MRTIPVAGPWVTQREIDYVADAAANAWYENANHYNERFEHAFREYIGVRHAVSLPSCTSALHLSLLALGIGPGDEVVVPDVTWIATAAPVRYVGATPVFADIDRTTWCMDAASLESCITERTRAIIPVDLYGGMPDWDAILTVAGRHGLPVVEDAAEAFGSTYKGRRAGSLGRTGTFSFHGSKTLTTGEGGMLVTDDDDLFKRVLFLRDHGRSPGDVSFTNLEVAWKYKMSSLQAAFGLAQTERAEELVEKKRTLFSWYEEHLGTIPGVALNAEPQGTRNSYWMVTVVLDPSFGLPKEKLIQLLREAGIASRPFFSALSTIPAFFNEPQAEAARKANPVAQSLAPYGVNLPSALGLTEDDVRRVCTELARLLR